jgi:hypothetical protein
MNLQPNLIKLTSLTLNHVPVLWLNRGTIPGQ